MTLFTRRQQDPEVRAAINRAFDVAMDFRHETADVDHLLLTLLQPPTGVVARVLQSLRIDRGSLLDAIVTRLQTTRTVTDLNSIALSPDLRTALSQSRVEADELGDRTVGAEHLFLAICRLDRVPVAKMLSSAGISHAVTRNEIVRLRRDRLIVYGMLILLAVIVVAAFVWYRNRPEPPPVTVSVVAPPNQSAILLGRPVPVHVYVKGKLAVHRLELWTSGMPGAGGQPTPIGSDDTGESTPTVVVVDATQTAEMGVTVSAQLVQVWGPPRAVTELEHTFDWTPQFAGPVKVEVVAVTTTGDYFKAVPLVYRVADRRASMTAVAEQLGQPRAPTLTPPPWLSSPTPEPIWTSPPPGMPAEPVWTSPPPGLPVEPVWTSPPPGLPVEPVWTSPPPAPPPSPTPGWPELPPPSPGGAPAPILPTPTPDVGAPDVSIGF